MTEGQGRAKKVKQGKRLREALGKVLLGVRKPVFLRMQYHSVAEKAGEGHQD